GGVVAGRRDDEDEEEPSNSRAAGDAGGLERADGSTPRKSAQRELRHQRRSADRDGDEDVEQHERRAAELSDEVRISPDVPQADRHADDRDQRAEARRERLAWFRGLSSRCCLARLRRYSFSGHQPSGPRQVAAEDQSGSSSRREYTAGKRACSHRPASTAASESSAASTSSSVL